MGFIFVEIILPRAGGVRGAIEPVSKCMESVFLERADSVAGCTQVCRLGAKLVAP